MYLAYFLFKARTPYRIPKYITFPRVIVQFRPVILNHFLCPNKINFDFFFLQTISPFVSYVFIWRCHPPGGASVEGCLASPNIAPPWRRRMLHHGHRGGAGDGVLQGRRQNKVHMALHPHCMPRRLEGEYIYV